MNWNLLLLTIFLLIVSSACESKISSNQLGILKEPKVTINPDITSSKFGGGAPSKLREFESDLVFELWESFDYKYLAGVSFDGVKEEFCIVSGEGVPLQIGQKVEIIDEARCLKSQYTRGDGTPFMRFPAGLIKIRIISTGQEGWVWTTSVEFESK